LSSLPRIKILRSNPRSRDTLEDLIGYMEVDIIAKSYLHIGTGFEFLSIDAIKKFEELVKRARTREDLRSIMSRFSEEVAKEPEAPVMIGDKLIIPGSTVKGNVRSRLELSFIPKDGQIRSCLIRAHNYPLQPPRRGEQGWRHFRIWEHALKFTRDEPCDYTKMQKVCILCDIFGTAGLVGLVHFNDFTGPSIHDVISLNLVSIGERLFVAKPESVFSGRIIFRNIKPLELGLLLYGMGIRRGVEGRSVLLGKHKYVKYDNIKLGIVTYKIKSLQLSKLSSSIEVEITVRPGDKVEGNELGKVTFSLLKLVNETFKEELLDIDEVKMLEQIEARA